MRLTREYAFDMIELVGKAVTTARKKDKDAGPEWDMDAQLQRFIDRWAIKENPLDKAVRESAGSGDDQFGLFQDTDWKDNGEGTVSDQEQERYSEWGSEEYEQRRARRYRKEFGDAVSCRLWEIQRQLRFKEAGVQDTLKRLQSLCNDLAKYISTGWATRLANIIDSCSRG